MIPLSQPDITDLEIDEVVSVLRGDRLSLGPKMAQFEIAIGRYIGVPHAVAVSSGTAGLHLCLCAMGIGQDDEVLVPSFTFVAAANVIRYVGATPVFVDVERATLNIDPTLIERAITPRTRAILVVHTFGVPAAMETIVEIARRHNLLLLEDACEALGAEYHGRKAGAFGDAAVFAFYPNKQITTGEGGMIVTPNQALAREMRALRNQGRYETDEWHQHSILGYNYRLSEINAALGCAQMQRLHSILERRAAAAQHYRDVLSSRPDLVLPPLTLEAARVSWFVYVLRLPETFARADRDDIVRRMGEAGIQCGRYFAPIHTQPAYAQMPLRFPLPVTESESERTLALPFFTAITTQQIERVCHTLLAAIKRRGISAEAPDGPRS